MVNHYLTADISLSDTNFEIQCWMSTEDLFKHDSLCYPFRYTYLGERCSWIIRTNYQMTSKILSMIGEQADRICSEQAAINYWMGVKNR